MKYVTVKVYPETRKRLKQLAAALGIDMAALADQVLEAAWIAYQKEAQHELSEDDRSRHATSNGDRVEGEL